MMSEITEYLFETSAIRAAEPDRPFWYTSGLFGPYYVNTHFLLGSEWLAGRLLDEIDDALLDTSRAGREALPNRITDFTQMVYEINGIYNNVMRISCNKIRNLGFDYISGGERRDFFFSSQIAWILGVPHISIFKNGDMVLTNEDRSRSWLIARGEGISEDSEDGVTAFARKLRDEIKGRRVLHIADLVTQASSYTRDWLPSLERLGAKVDKTMAAVDRNQGGREALADAGVELHALAVVNESLFREAAHKGLINEAQLEQVLAYTHDPEAYVRDFLKSHPDFLEQEARKDAKTAERVERFRSLQAEGSGQRQG